MKLTLEQQVANAQVILNAAVRSYQRLTGEYTQSNAGIEVVNALCVLLCHGLEGKGEAPAEVPYKER